MIEDWTYQPQDKLAAEIADIMLAQLRLYPEMEFRDAVKLLYQQCFGPGQRDGSRPQAAPGSHCCL